MDAFGKIEGLERVLEGELAIARLVGGEFVKIGRGPLDAHGQGTEIVQGGNLDLAGLDGVQDAGHQGEPRAVAQFGIFKTQFTDFEQHQPPIGLAMRIPAGRK